MSPNPLNEKWPQIPNGLAEIKKVFGDCDASDFEAKNIALFDLPYPMKFGTIEVKRARCHKLLVPVFISIFTEIKEAGLAFPMADDFGGIFNKRPIRGKSKPSCHSWGIAIDLEVASNPMGSGHGKMDPRIVLIFARHGFVWGGNFKSRSDPMHFQYATGY